MRTPEGRAFQAGALEVRRPCRRAGAVYARSYKQVSVAGTQQLRGEGVTEGSDG